MDAATIIARNALSPQALSLLRLLAKMGLPVLALALVVWAGAYVTGLSPTLGTKARNDVWAGIGKAGGGYSIGTNTFFLFAGQTAYVDYDVSKVTAGGLSIGLIKRFSPGSGASKLKWVREKGKGRATFRVRDTGLYRFRIEGHFTGGSRAYDVTYSATWGALFGSPETPKSGARAEKSYRLRSSI